MTSASSAGASVITLQFGLILVLDVAEQEVQAAINAASNLLPSDLPAPPIYAKVNPADAPILTLAVTSKTLPLTAARRHQPRRGWRRRFRSSPASAWSASPAASAPPCASRLNPQALAAHGLNIDDVRTILGNANVNTPKGSFDGPAQSSTINANDQITSADQYATSSSPIATAIRCGCQRRRQRSSAAPENTKLAAWANRTPAILLNVQRQPGANVIATVDSMRKLLPKLLADLPAAVDVDVLTDRTVTIRASVADVEFELVLAIVLVVAVIFVFLRTLPAT